MTKKSTQIITVALLTSAAIIAFAFNQQSANPFTISGEAFYIAAAIICLLPVCYAALRRGRASSSTSC